MTLHSAIMVAGLADDRLLCERNGSNPNNPAYCSRRGQCVHAIGWGWRPSWVTTWKEIGKDGEAI